jgi:hypothetical protein
MFPGCLVLREPWLGGVPRKLSSRGAGTPRHSNWALAHREFPSSRFVLASGPLRAGLWLCRRLLKALGGLALQDEK